MSMIQKADAHLKQKPDAHQLTEFKLYIAGDSPSSHAVIGELSTILPKFGIAMAQVEIIDVFNHQADALAAELLVAPTLLVRRHGSENRFQGDLRRQDDICGWLGTILD